MKWLPIETADKSACNRDHPILAWRSSEHGQAWALVYWSKKWNDWADYWDGDPAPMYPPTHWMPLPEPPQEIADETE